MLGRCWQVDRGFHRHWAVISGHGVPRFDAGDRTAAETALLSACRAYDKAAAQGVIHKNNAANHKSRLRKQFNAAA